jgi:hypothetical protein
VRRAGLGVGSHDDATQRMAVRQQHSNGQCRPPGAARETQAPQPEEYWEGRACPGASLTCVRSHSCVRILAVGAP